MTKVFKESFPIITVTFNFWMIKSVSSMSCIKTFNLLISFISNDMRFSIPTTSRVVEMVLGRDNCLENRDRDCAFSTAAFNMPNSANICWRFSMSCARRQFWQLGSAIRKDRGSMLFWTQVRWCQICLIQISSGWIAVTCPPIKYSHSPCANCWNMNLRVCQII